MNIALCLITGDDPQLPAAIKSAQPLVDHTVVAYTGAQKKVATLSSWLTQEHAISGHLLVTSYPWGNDFSEARNESFRVARGTGADWLFWMDSDDLVEDATAGPALSAAEAA